MVPPGARRRQHALGRRVTTNLEPLYSGSTELSSGLFPHLATNAINRADNFACFVSQEATYQAVVVIQVDP